MTGDDKLRQDVITIFKQHYDDIKLSSTDYINEEIPGDRADLEIMTATEEAAHKVLALIRQDRRELLEFLKNHAVAENDEVYFIKVKKSSLDAELQHLTGLEEREADHE